eukprot:4810984-Alexandrium_andersonii.AAC.1
MSRPSPVCLKGGGNRAVCPAAIAIPRHPDMRPLKSPGPGGLPRCDRDPAASGNCATLTLGNAAN